MKENDYFVISYRILAYLYDCLKEAREVDRDVVSYQALGINEAYHNWIMKALYEAGRISGVYPINGSKYVKIVYKDLEITEQGIIFLQENSSIEKAKRFLKDIKAIIPGA